MLLLPSLLCHEAHSGHHLTAGLCCEREARVHLGKAAALAIWVLRRTIAGVMRQTLNRRLASACQGGQVLFINQHRPTFFDGLDGAYCVGMSLAPILKFCTRFSSSCCQCGALQRNVRKACTE